ncbi:MAG: CBS domain-containing protein [Nitrosomonas sp.]|nr:CBS domain-containing protein [Nitrosomonas sp.]MDP1952025.1 CBS domain-containing protein [Nitrosomonas sp.]
MPVSEICQRNVVTLQGNDTALDAAKLMRQHHIGDVIVVEIRQGVPIPVGIITDRDLIVEIVATELDVTVITVGDIMAKELFTIKESMDIFDAIQYMRRKTVRRLPVVSEDGGLVGILTLDDVLALLSEELLNLAKLVGYERKKEIRHRP